MDAKRISEEMNSDMFDRIERSSYNISGFSNLEIDQAKESFTYNGYKVYEKDTELSVKKIN